MHDNSVRMSANWSLITIKFSFMKLISTFGFWILYIGFQYNAYPTVIDTRGVHEIRTHIFGRTHDRDIFFYFYVIIAHFFIIFQNISTIFWNHLNEIHFITERTFIWTNEKSDALASSKKCTSIIRKPPIILIHF